MSRLALVSILLFGGCASTTRTEDPTGTVLRYAEALREGDARTAWALLDEEARGGRSEEEHAELMAQNASELASQAEALKSAAPRVQARARALLRSGETVVLVLEDGVWRIEGGVLDAVGLGSPLDAVAAFRRSLMRRDLRGIERVLARETRAEWEEEVRRLVEATADPDDLKVEVQGNRAHVRTTGGGSIELVRESGEWRIVDVHDP